MWSNKYASIDSSWSNLKKSLFLAIFGIIQILLGFLTNILIVRFYGVGIETDIFLVSQTLPQIITSIVVSTLNSVWLTNLSAQKFSKIKWNYILSKSLGQATVISIFISTLILILLKPLNYLFFNGFDELQRNKIAIYTSVFLLMMVFNILSSQLVNAFRTKNEFFYVEVINIIFSILILPIIIFIYKTKSLFFFSLLLCLKSFLILFFQMKFLKWPKINIIKGLSDKKSWYLMRPVFSGSVIYKFTPLIDRYFLSFSSVGMITLFTLSQSIISSISQIIEKSIVIETISNFGYLIKNKKYKLLDLSIKRNLLKILFIVCLFAIFLILFKGSIINYSSIFFNLNNKFSTDLWFFIILSIGLLHSSSSASIAVNAFYAFGDTKTPMITGLIGFLLSIIVKYFLFQYFGVYGLVLGITFHYILNFITNTKYLYKKNELKY